MNTNLDTMTLPAGLPAAAGRHGQEGVRMNQYEVEYTDTFGGEANYCWVKREVIEVTPEAPDAWDTSAATAGRKRRAYRREIMRKAKASMGLTGVRGVKHDHGDMIEFRPYGSCTVMFVTYKDAS